MPVYDTTKFVLNAVQAGENYPNAQVLSVFPTGTMLKVSANGVLTTAIRNTDYLSPDNTATAQSVFTFDGAQYLWVKNVPNDANYVLSKDNVNIANRRVLRTSDGLTQEENGTTKSITIKSGPKLKSLNDMTAAGFVTYDPTIATFVNRGIVSTSNSISISSPYGLFANVDMNVVNNTSIQKINVLNNDSFVGARFRLNFKTTSSVQATINENTLNDCIDISLATGAIQVDSEKGALIVGGDVDWERLSIGDANTYLKSDGETASWESIDANEQPWTILTTGSAELSVNTKHVVNYTGGVCELTLPEYQAGEWFRIGGYSSMGWQIVLSGSQQIIFGDKQTSVGNVGSLQSTLGTDSVELVAVEDNGALIIVSGTGTVQLT